MTPYKTLIPLIALVATACLKLPEIEPAQEDAGTPDTELDSGTPDTEQPQPDAGSSGGTLSSVRLIKPTGTVFTNGTLDVQVELVGSPTTLVELVLDGKDTVAVLEPPAYKLAWNTASVQEGPHQLTARAVLGSKSLVSEARTVTVDRTPPQFVLRTPAPNAQEVSVHEPIYAVFSEAVRAETLTDSSVRLTMTGGTMVPRTVSLSSDGKTLRVQPASSPVAPATMMLSTTSAITDLAGNGLATPSEPWIWNLPAWISTEVSPELGTEAYTVQLRQDDTGGSVISFLGPDGELCAVHKDSTGYWRSLSTDPQFPATRFTLPSEHGYVTNFALQLDQSRTPVLAYSTGTSHHDGKSISVQHWQDNTWKTFTTNVPYDSYHQTLNLGAFQLTKKGMPVIAWAGLNGNTYLYVHHWTGSSWTTPGDSYVAETDNPSGYYDYRPSLQLDANDTPIIAWSAYDGKVYVARPGNFAWVNYGEGLSAYPQLSNRALDPSLQLDSEGNPIVAWRQADSTGTKHIHVRAWNNGTWQDRGTALSAATGATDTSEPELYSDSSNRLILVWHEMVAGQPQTHFKFWSGSQWETLISPLLGERFSIAFDAQGNMAAAKEVGGSSIGIFKLNR